MNENSVLTGGDFVLESSNFSKFAEDWDTVRIDRQSVSASFAHYSIDFISVAQKFAKDSSTDEATSTGKDGCFHFSPSM